MKKVLLVDGNSLLYRAYFANAYRSQFIMKTKSGIYTNAVFSFANMLTSLLSQRDYYDVKVAFDKGKKTFRHDKLEDYKAGRQQTPDELIMQFPIAREFLEAANIGYYEMDNVEADDLIGSMAKKIYETNPNVVIEILTSDQDMYQLINDRTFVLSPRSGTSDLKEYDIQALNEKWHIKPNQVPDLKGLMGDKSDNLKGVPGIGEKKAILLVDQYGSLEGIYEHIDEIKGAMQKNLIEGKESGFLSKELATIDTSIHLDNFGIYKLNLTVNPLVEFLNKYEMFSLVKRFSTKVETINKEEIVDIKILDRWSSEFVGTENTIFVESLNQNYHMGKILGIGISNEKGTFYLEFWNEEQSGVLALLNKTNVNFDEALNEFLKSDLPKNTYDLKRTVKLLENAGYQPNFDSFTYDMMSVGYILNSSITSTFQNHLRLLAPDWNLEVDEVFYGKGAKQNTALPVEQKAQFIGRKAYYLAKVKPVGLEMLKERNQLDLYKDIDFPLIKVLKDMEDHGVLIDRKELEKQTKNAELKLQQINAEVQEMLGDQIDPDFNLASPKQVKELLYEKLNLPDNLKGSTSKEALDLLVGAHPVIIHILEYRKWAKLYSTYLSGFEKYIHNDNKVYTIYNQNLTTTGRLSSIEPNLQNISVRDEEQKDVRKIFIIDNDYLWMSYDYSQIELRVLAQMANEQNMIEIFSHDGDIHQESARKIFNLAVNEKVTDQQRRVAKVFNFGIIYGLSEFGLAKDLNISFAAAKEFIQKYFESFPAIENFKVETLKFASQHGYVETLTRRSRYVPELHSKIYFQRQAGERAAINMPIQGTAADILKLAMINIFEEFKTQKLKSYMSSQIHDEIIFAVEKSEAKVVQKIIEQEMKKAFNVLKEKFKLTEPIKVKLTVSSSEGKNWYELK